MIRVIENGNIIFEEDNFNSGKNFKVSLNESFGVFKVSGEINSYSEFISLDSLNYISNFVFECGMIIKKSKSLIDLVKEFNECLRFFEESDFLEIRISNTKTYFKVSLFISNDDENLKEIATLGIES